MTSNEQVYTGSECRVIDNHAIDELGVPGFQLMVRAARFTVDVLREQWPEVKSVSVVCGSGNNAGDGYLVAALLRDRQFDVEVHQVGDPTRLKGDAQTAFERAQWSEVPVAKSLEFHGDLVVDALLGTGVTGTIREPFAAAIKRINASEKPVLALDLPSGIDPDTGGLLVDEPVRACTTACFVGRKAGLLTGVAPNFAGEVRSSNLGIPASAFRKVRGIPVLPVLPAEAKLPVREPASFKNVFGHVLVLGGNQGMGGAALLAGESALRMGAGLVSVVTHPQNVSGVLARRPELMVLGTEGWEIDSSLLDRASVIVVGPGLGHGTWAEQALDCAIKADKPLIVDADALNLLAANKRSLSTIVILTPHPGEAARLLDYSTQQVEQDRFGAATKLSTIYNATVVLKGAGSLVAQSGELQGLCDIAEPALSTAGSGDVLTGVIGASLAQLQDPLQAARLGVYLHAKAGTLARCVSDGKAVVASDVIDALRPWG